MSSLQGFRCRHCRMELVARPPDRDREPADWMPPIICCGDTLLRLPPEQVLAARLPRRRRASCPRCGYEVQVIVHPEGPLVCLFCQQELVTGAAEPWRAGVPASPLGRGGRVSTMAVRPRSLEGVVENAKDREAPRRSVPGTREGQPWPGY